MMEEILEIIQLRDAQQCTAVVDAIRSDNEENERWVIAEDVIEQTQPLIPIEDLREECLQQCPSIDLQATIVDVPRCSSPLPVRSLCDG